MPWAWQAWVMLLGAVNVVGGIAFWERIEGRITVLALVAAFGLMVGITATRGFVRLLGLGHLVVWPPLLVWLATRPDALSPATAFGRWTIALFAVNGISLAIDLVDVVRYARGERAPAGG